MVDPLRTDSSHATDGASDSARDAKIEQLLLAGLDHYFAAEYESAVNIWTRALFLDRSHAKARAYIERARSAMAEQQRESEELLHRGTEAFDRGQADEARRLLQDAMSRGVPSDEALALLDRLDRLDPGLARDRKDVGDRIDRGRPSAGGVASGRGAASPLPWFIAFAIIAAALFVVGQSVDWRTLTGRGLKPDLQAPASDGSGPEVPPLTLPMPRRGEGALARARAFVTSGHLHEALAALDGVKSTDPEKAEADQLRTRLQHELMALTSLDATADAPKPGAPGR